MSKTKLEPLMKIDTDGNPYITYTETTEGDPCMEEVFTDARDRQEIREYVHLDKDRALAALRAEFGKTNT